MGTKHSILYLPHLMYLIVNHLLKNSGMTATERSGKNCECWRYYDSVLLVIHNIRYINIHY